MMPATKETSHKAGRLSMAIASRVRQVRLMQPENASFPMRVMLFGRLMLVRPVQPANARWPIVVSLFGRVMLVRLVHLKNAW